MPRRSARPIPDRAIDLTTHTRVCPACSGPLWSAATVRRTVVTLEGLVRLRLQVRSCRNPHCPRHRVCLRPEQEGRFALPQHESSTKRNPRLIEGGKLENPLVPANNRGGSRPSAVRPQEVFE